MRRKDPYLEAASAHLKAFHDLDDDDTSYANEVDEVDDTHTQPVVSRRHKLNKATFLTYAGQHYFVTRHSHAKPDSELPRPERRGTLERSAMAACRTKIDDMFKPTQWPELRTMVRLEGDNVVIQNNVQAGNKIGYYTGRVKMEESKDGGLYNCLTGITRSYTKGTYIDHGPVRFEVVIDAHDFKIYKEELSQKFGENLMCFINHGCPGCDNVYIDID